jgi:uncharacterized protein (TIGR02217 family)
VTQLTQSTHYSINYTTGVITLTALAQSTFNGQTLGVVGEFYTPVRFDVDRLDIQIMLYRVTEGLGDISDVPIVEVRDFQ